MALLSTSARTGMKDRRARAAMALNTTTSASTSFRVMGPSAWLNRSTRARRPGIDFFSGGYQSMKYTQRRIVMTTPTGNMYQVSSKKPMVRPSVSAKNPRATAPRAAPRRVMMLPAPATKAMPMKRPLPNRVGSVSSV